MDTQKLHIKQRMKIEEKIYWTERKCDEEIDRKILDIHRRFGQASKIE